jgi:hypothetical protein
MLSNIESASLMTACESAIFCFLELFGQVALSLTIKFCLLQSKYSPRTVDSLSCENCLVDCCGMESRMGCLWIERGEAFDRVSVMLALRCPWCHRRTSLGLIQEDQEVWEVAGCRWAPTLPVDCR